MTEIIAAAVGAVIGAIGMIISAKIRDKEVIKKVGTKIENAQNQKEPNDIEIFGDIESAFNCFFDKINTNYESNRINKLRIYASKLATISPRFFEKHNLTIDECVILIRKLPQNHCLYDETFDKEREIIKKKWQDMDNINKEKLSFIEYDRLSDFWYVICDDKFLITDLFTLHIGDNNIYKSYALQKDKTPMVVTSNNKSTQKYILRYISQFENYVKHYNQK